MNPTLEAALHWAFADPRDKIQQNEYELRTFLEKVDTELRPERTVELGTWRGVTGQLLSLATSQLTLSLDITDYGFLQLPFAAKFAHFLWSARDPVTFRRVKDFFGEPIDLLFIDDGHRIEEVTEEYALWKPLVRPGGWIAFHDINPEANQCAPGVHPDICQSHVFWKSLPQPKTEIIDPNTPAAPGIGYIVA